MIHQVCIQKIPAPLQKLWRPGKSSPAQPGSLGAQRPSAKLPVVTWVGIFSGSWCAHPTTMASWTVAFFQVGAVATPLKNMSWSTGRSWDSPRKAMENVALNDSRKVSTMKNRAWMGLIPTEWRSQPWFLGDLTGFIHQENWRFKFNYHGDTHATWMEIPCQLDQKGHTCPTDYQRINCKIYRTTQGCYCQNTGSWRLSFERLWTTAKPPEFNGLCAFQIILVGQPLLPQDSSTGQFMSPHLWQNS